MTPRRRAHKVLTPRGEVRPPPPPGERPLLLANAEEVVTLSGPARPRKRAELRDLRVVERGAVLVDAGLIREVGPSDELLARHRDSARVLDLSGKVLLPGFVDPHTHLVFAGSRHEELDWKIEGLSYQAIAARGGGLMNTVRKTREASAEALFDSARRRLDALLHHGTTTVEAKSGYGLSPDAELKILDVIVSLDARHAVDLVPTFLGAHAVPSEYAGQREKYLDLIIREALPAVAAQGAARFCDIWIDTGYFTADDARRLFAAARDRGLAPKVHADELEESGGAEAAAEVHAVSADHLIHASRAGIEALADAGTIAVLLPATSFSSRIPYANARAIIEAGVPPALGTDLNPNSWTESMQFVIALACHHMGVYPAEAIAMATVNAAYAVGRGGEVGTIEPGKRADLIVLDAESHRHLGYRTSGNLVEKVFKDGRIVVDRQPGTSHPASG